MAIQEYRAPRQKRALESEGKFLDALADLLREHSINETSVADIANRANLGQSAFMARFGSKRGALACLFKRYCDDVYAALAELESALVRETDLEALICRMSQVFESLLLEHYGVNHAMHEQFLQEKQIDDQTKGIFSATCAFLGASVSKFADATPSSENVYAAVQLLVTLNYNYVLGAMPAFPQEAELRHSLITKLILAALQLGN